MEGSSFILTLLSPLFCKVVTSTSF